MTPRMTWLYWLLAAGIALIIAGYAVGSAFLVVPGIVIATGVMVFCEFIVMGWPPYD